MLDFLCDVVFYVGLALITGIVFLEFRNVIHSDFTHERYYPLGVRPEEQESFTQWITGVDKSGMSADFRHNGPNDDDSDSDDDDDDEIEDEVFDNDVDNGNTISLEAENSSSKFTEQPSQSVEK